MANRNRSGKRESDSVPAPSLLTPHSSPSFHSSIPDEEVAREKRKARDLRKTSWWKRKLAAGRCHYCGKPFPRETLTMDHLVPIIRGGKSVRANCVVACKDCNNKKKYLLPVEWEEYLEGRR